MYNITIFNTFIQNLFQFTQNIITNCFLRSLFLLCEQDMKFYKFSQPKRKPFICSKRISTLCVCWLVGSICVDAQSCRCQCKVSADEFQSQLGVVLESSCQWQIPQKVVFRIWPNMWPVVFGSCFGCRAPFL